eukprot:6474822-Amphidinium_carterae.3
MKGAWAQRCLWRVPWPCLKLVPSRGFDHFKNANDANAGSFMSEVQGRSTTYTIRQYTDTAVSSYSHLNTVPHRDITKTGARKGSLSRFGGDTQYVC